MMWVFEVPWRRLCGKQILRHARVNLRIRKHIRSTRTFGSSNWSDPCHCSNEAFPGFVCLI